MADISTLGKRRTIRFESDFDRLLSARAAAEKKSVSRLIFRFTIYDLRFVRCVGIA
jgi:predicted DNA-binding ribbon-helix-helix protein